ncbi:hypothetical protein PPL_06331 [Heterostelium album PN500]|uniref:Uncharacterized protein n=1 Tax=Heterostelium pallidum (strain ATCC 26659 / Pp 5 / PN500) TaxID=670386 RepID=D3BCV3_HETP5|nr:hypothetical protein PPL_06331 [Heterostelium album PN500]EFA80745.1 hypothetical protein PPL_06331 [Heterostelium album PN500]|eukprot:XP_020432865.1 hypothetical protein PPL_06331 [Heterostelium album PN500]
MSSIQLTTAICKAVVDLGAIGRNTGAIPQKIFFFDKIRFRYFENDIYDLYYTYMDYSGQLCNYTGTITINTFPKVDITQPLCLFTNATINPIAGMANGDTFTMQLVGSGDSKLQFPQPGKPSAFMLQINPQNAASYNFLIPTISSNISYTISTYPTCTTSGSVTLNYNGILSNIQVNGVPLIFDYTRVMHWKWRCVRTNSTYPQSTNGKWTNLTNGQYRLKAVYIAGPTCSSSVDIGIGNNTPEVTFSTVNQCSAGLNGTATFSTLLNTKKADNVIYYVDGISSNSATVSLPIGNHSVKSFVNETGLYRQFSRQQQVFSIASNRIDHKVTLNGCQSAKLQGQLKFKLYNVTMDGVETLVGSATGNTANITNLPKGTYRFTIAEYSGCLISSTSPIVQSTNHHHHPHHQSFS